MIVSAANQPILSPCIGVCELDATDHCIGCRRSADEIAIWGRISESERERIMAELPGRGSSQGSG